MTADEENLDDLTVDDVLSMSEEEQRFHGLGRSYAIGWVRFGAREFERTEAPMWAICALRYATDWQLDLPDSVSRWASAGLMRYLSSDDSLEKCLSLNAAGRGKNSPRDAFRRETGRIVEMSGMFDLTRSLGFTVEQAAFAVAARKILIDQHGRTDIDLAADEYDAALDRVDALRDQWKSSKTAREIRGSAKPIKARRAVASVFPRSCWPVEFRG